MTFRDGDDDDKQIIFSMRTRAAGISAKTGGKIPVKESSRSTSKKSSKTSHVVSKEVQFPSSGLTHHHCQKQQKEEKECHFPSPTTITSWVQCSGHEDAFLPSKRGTIWKKIPLTKGKKCEENYEIQAYKKLMMDDMIRDFIPHFYQEIDFEDDHFMEIQDLLHQFRSNEDQSNPLYIMDIKMGTRTFLEQEASCPTERSDLYDKMVKIDASEPTPEENAKKSVTKLRYMSFRESLSSTSRQGFRIEGVQVRILFFLFIPLFFFTLLHI